MIEQEMASIIKFVLDCAGNPAPYYWNVPQNFNVPAAYFPPPEIETGGETFLTYNMDYAWYVKLFHRTTQGAYALGNAVAHSLRAARNLVPLIAPDGGKINGSWVRMNDPRLKVLDDGAAQLTLTWRSRRPYSDVLSTPEKANTVSVGVLLRSGKTITDAYAEVLESYSVLRNPGSQPE